MMSRPLPVGIKNFEKMIKEKCREALAQIETKNTHMNWKRKVTGMYCDMGLPFAGKNVWLWRNKGRHSLRRQTKNGKP